MVCVNTKFITEITEDYNLFNDLKLGGEWKAFFMLRGEEPGEVVLELKYGDDKIEIAKDKVVVTVISANLTIDSNNDGKINEEDDKVEDSESLIFQRVQRKQKLIETYFRKNYILML